MPTTGVWSAAKVLSPAQRRGTRRTRKRVGALDPVDRERDVELLGLDVARLDRRRVGGRAQQQPGFRLEIERLVDVDHQRPGALDRDRGLEQESRAALGHEAERGDAGERGELVGPGAGGVDQHRGLEAAGPGLDPPGRAVGREAGHLGLDDQPAAAGAQALEIGLVDRSDVEVHGARVVEPAAT